MSRNPIFVRHITNLTDARYFAAMEVDWISMELSEEPESFSRWHTLRDWIEGVRLVAEPVHADEQLMSKIIIDALPDGLMVNDTEFIHMTAGIQLFVLTDQVPAVSQDPLMIHILTLEEVKRATLKWNELPGLQMFIEHDWTAESLQDVLSSGYKGGICLHGKEEIQTGLMDFSEMDELLALR